MADPVTKPALRLLAVIVLYKMQPRESAALRTLLTAKTGLRKVEDNCQILLYDNSPGGCDPGPLPDGVQYKAAEQNAGLSAAYNHALMIAERESCAWLLLLDQDTTLPSDYLFRIRNVVSMVAGDEKVAAIVPRMLDGGRPVSPACLKFWGVSYSAFNMDNTVRREIQATNSATLFRVRRLEEIGGFSPYFWLDYLDGYIFHQLYVRGLKVYVAWDIEVEHKLSLLHEGELKPDRFHNILWAESAFWDLYGTAVQRLAFGVRLLGRIWRQRARGHNPAILQLTWNELKRRVFHSKAHRINEWKREMERRMESSSARGCEESLEGRPSISVCMAAYNGERYIKAQLQSILKQLTERDEVIVVDDASTDKTKEVIRSFQDCRISLIEHKKNQGVLRTFEEAVRSASGEVLFLSDQDDIWAPDKILVVLRMFQLHTDADIAVSDASLINEDGVPIGPSYYAQRGGFHPGVVQNITRCHYLGCTMAFRSRLLSKILPFPVGYDILHDLWIGVLNSFVGGKTLYINRPLVYYRRHEDNATGNRQLSIIRKARIRWGLCWLLVTCWLRLHRRNRSNLVSSNDVR